MLLFLVSFMFRFDLRSPLIIFVLASPVCSLLTHLPCFTTNESHLHLTGTAHFLVYLNPLQRLFWVRSHCGSLCVELCLRTLSVDYWLGWIWLPHQTDPC